MIEFIKDSSIVLIRILTILPLVLFITIFMGKRTIGELPIFDYLVIIILGSVVGADIAEPNIKHIPTAVAVILIGLLQKIVSHIKISNRRVGRLITFEPMIVIQNGILLNKNLKKIRYTIDNVLQLLREKNVFDINEVETAIIEANGNLSILKKHNKNAVVVEDMGIVKKTSHITLPLIVEGNIYLEVLVYFGLDKAWLIMQLNDMEIHDLNSIFFASINPSHELQISLKNEGDIKVPVVKH